MDAGTKKAVSGLVFAGVLGAFLYFSPVGYASGLRGVRRGPAREQELRALAAKWGDIFDVPEELSLTIMKIESSFHPDTINMTARAIPLGGAWGAMQVTKTTAQGIAKRLKSHPNGEVQRVLKKWKGSGENLLDAELGSMFGVHYLSGLWKEFKDFTLAVAAYQQGPGKIRKMLKLGQAIPSQLPPKGKAYVAMAEKAREYVA